MCFSYHGCREITLKLKGMKQPFFMDQEFRQDTSVWLPWSHYAWGRSQARILRGSFAHMFGYQCWLSAETAVGLSVQDTSVRTERDFLLLPQNELSGLDSFCPLCLAPSAQKRPVPVLDHWGAVRNVLGRPGPGPESSCLHIHHPSQAVTGDNHVFGSWE